MTRPLLAPTVALAVLVACAPASSPGPSGVQPASPGQTAEHTRGPSGPFADLILLDGNVRTMDAARPDAHAIAIAGDRIIGVGSSDEMRALGGPDTVVIDLADRTVVPGFIDAHQHRIGDGEARLGASAAELIDAAVAQGWTTVGELYVDEGRLDELRGLDESGVLRLRVNAYLPVQENSPEGRRLGDWFNAYTPGQVISPHVRVGGLKVFTDYDNATILLWKQADLDAFLLEQHRKGWQLGVKTVSTRSLDMILKAFSAIETAEPAVTSARGRLEHMLFATQDQISSIKDLGLIPVFNINVPSDLIGVPDVDDLIAREPDGAYAPWGSLFEAGIPAAGMTGFPSLYVDEPSGAPFGSPIHLIYQAVTRAGRAGQTTPASLLREATSATDAVRALTINAARASFEENDKGSLAPGKLADLIVLSRDPVVEPAEQINDITVVMTLIGGEVQYCAPYSEALCAGLTLGSAGSFAPATPGAPTDSQAPGPENVAIAASARASSAHQQYPASNAIDGTPEHWNAVDPAPGWIELELRTPSRIDLFLLTVAQDPAGESTHEIWVRRVGGVLEQVHVFAGVTRERQVLSFEPREPLEDIDLVRIVTTELAGGLAPAWHEIELMGLPS